jgi:hypothetical protein
VNQEYALGVWRQQPAQKGFDVEVGAGITEQEFEAYVDAVSRYRSLTERNTYQVLQRNYIRLASMLEMYTNLEKIGGTFRTVDKRSVSVLFMGEMTNWLASTRLYLESERDFIVRQFGEGSDELRGFKGATSRAAKTYLGYRFLYDLRDYAQHCGPPVSGMNVSRDSAGNRLVEMYLDRSELLTARFKWNSYAKKLLATWPERISIMPLVEEAMKGFRLIEDEVLRILIRRCGAAVAKMREGIARIGGREGHKAVFKLPSPAGEEQFAWQTFPEPSALDLIEDALTTDDPLAKLPKQAIDASAWSPPQTHANSQAVAVMAAALEHGNGSEFTECVNRVIHSSRPIGELIRW